VGSNVRKVTSKSIFSLVFTEQKVIYETVSDFLKSNKPAI